MPPTATQLPGASNREWSSKKPISAAEADEVLPAAIPVVYVPFAVGPFTAVETEDCAAVSVDVVEGVLKPACPAVVVELTDE
jgi:hypothetical protein